MGRGLHDAGAMSLPRTTLVLLSLIGAAAAQTPIDVSDLLGSAAARRAPEGEFFVGRVVANPDRDFDDGRNWPNHGVLGGGHLIRRMPSRSVSQGDYFGEEEEPIGPLSEDSFLEVLNALKEVDDLDLQIHHSGRRVLIDTDYPELVISAVNDIRALMPPPIDVHVMLEREVDGRVEVLVDGRHRFRGDTTTVLGSTARRQLVRDFDVEIAQSAAVANPIIGELVHGASVGIRARPMPFRDEVIVEAIARVGRPLKTEPYSPHPAMGPLDRAAMRVDEAGFAFRVTRGSSTVHEWQDLDGATVRLTCGVDWQARQPAGDNSGRVAITNLFGPPVLAFRSSPYFELEEPEGISLADFVEASAGRNDDSVVHFDRGNRTGGGALVLAAGGTGPRAGRQLAAEFDALLQPVRVELEILDAPYDVLVKADGELPEGVRVLGRASGPALADLPVCFASAREQSYVRDFDVEVAQAARIPDPKVDAVEDGWFATLTALRGTAGKVDAIECDLWIDELVELRKLEVTISPRVVAATDSTPTPSPYLEADVITIELPEEKQLRLDTEAALDADGRFVFTRQASALLGSQRRLVVRGRVTTP